MASGFTFDVNNFNASIDELKKRVNSATRDATAIGGHLIEGNAKRGFEGSHAKGQPHVGGNKPNVVSGTLYRSIKLIPDSPEPVGLGVWRVTVAPTTVYGRRIELGFHGADSLGRNYNQSGMPFLKPGLDRAIPILPRIFNDAWRVALGV